MLIPWHSFYGSLFRLFCGRLSDVGSIFHREAGNVHIGYQRYSHKWEKEESMKVKRKSVAWASSIDLITRLVNIKRPDFHTILYFILPSKYISKKKKKPIGFALAKLIQQINLQRISYSLKLDILKIDGID